MKVSLFIALLLSLWATVVLVVTGPEAFAKRGASLHELVLLYFAGAVVSGALVGVLMPLWRTTVGAAVLGAVAALPVAVFIRIGAIGLSDWSSLDIKAIAAMALIGGPVAALTARRTMHAD